MSCFVQLIVQNPNRFILHGYYTSLVANPHILKWYLFEKWLKQHMLVCIINFIFFNSQFPLIYIFRNKHKNILYIYKKLVKAFIHSFTNNCPFKKNKKKTTKLNDNCFLPLCLHWDNDCVTCRADTAAEIIWECSSQPLSTNTPWENINKYEIWVTRGELSKTHRWRMR